MLHGEVTEKDAELHTLRKSVKSLTIDVERESKAAVAAKQQQQKVSDTCLQEEIEARQHVGVSSLAPLPIQAQRTADQAAAKLERVHSESAQLRQELDQLRRERRQVRGEKRWLCISRLYVRWRPTRVWKNIIF